MSTKRGLARNPLELVLGRSRLEPGDEQGRGSVPELVAQDFEQAEQRPSPSALKEQPTLPPAEEQEGRAWASEYEPAKPEVRKPRAPVRKRTRVIGEQPMVQSPEAVRVGTIKRPYLRMDGIAMRQVSLSLRVDLMQQANICAIKQGLRSNEIVQLALENYLRDFGE